MLQAAISRLFIDSMKEQNFIKIINDITQSPFLGDDCAYLKDYGLVTTQDNFIEDVHFKREWATPFQIGYKATVVNISDILAAGAIPKYLTVGLSLPNDIDDEFIKEFYLGVKAGSYGAEIIGGDITGADKIFVSITALGSDKERKISSRRNAKVGYKIITSGKYGLSTLGLNELMNGGNNQELIKAHLEPSLNVKFSKAISAQIETDYAMMDTSDGLADALYKIAESSGVKITAKNIDGMYCAEDYNLVAAVPSEFLSKISDYEIIGEVKKFDGYYLEIGDKKYINYNQLGTYNHFGE